jgi:hypothetical protein
MFSRCCCLGEKNGMAAFAVVSAAPDVVYERSFFFGAGWSSWGLTRDDFGWCFGVGSNGVVAECWVEKGECP